MDGSKREKLSFFLSLMLHGAALIGLVLGGGGLGNGGTSKEKHKGTGEANKYGGVSVTNIIPKEKIVEVSIVDTPPPPPIKSEILTKHKKERKKKAEKKHKKRLKKDCPGKWYGGIGIEETYNKIFDLTTIVTVYPGYPADEAGLMVGDHIIWADQPQIIGPPGTKLTMKIQRGNIFFTVVIVRGKVCHQ